MLSSGWANLIWPDLTQCIKSGWVDKINLMNQIKLSVSNLTQLSKLHWVACINNYMSLNCKFVNVI